LSAQESQIFRNLAKHKVYLQYGTKTPLLLSSKSDINCI
jgi:hypothetical protein